MTSRAFGGRGLVYAQGHDGVAPFSQAPNLHEADVDVVLARNSPDSADNPRPVLVLDEQHVTVTRCDIEPELVDPNDVAPAHDVRPRNNRCPRAGRELNGQQVTISLRGLFLAYSDVHSPLGNDHVDIHDVDSLLDNWGQEPPNHGGLQKQGVVLCDLPRQGEARLAELPLR